jgi:polyphosphate:AMP phosphotransferase
MFEAAEIDHGIDKEEYARLVPELRAQLLDAQHSLLESKRASVVVVVAGVEGAGKGEAVNLLNSWLDPRYVRTHGMGDPSSEETEKPYLWRFWRRLPPRGQIAIFFGSWYTQPILDKAYGESNDSNMDKALERIRRFERMLTDERVTVLKLWFHLSKKQQKKRLKRLEQDKKTRWRVTDRDWKHFELYDEFISISSRALRVTSTDNAPWHIISGAEPRYRNVTVGRIILAGLASPPKQPDPPPVQVLHPRAPADGKLIVQSLDLTKKLKKKVYREKLELYQGKLNLLTRHKRFNKRSLIVVFEGMDAAGKGGAIRRIAGALDARMYQIVPIAAPTDEELARPYLWRFWRRAPHRRKVVIFDRSWYGRVLVERIEGFADPADWARAYSEINDFEEQLIENGAVLAKLWLHIDRDEQLRRFRVRESTPFKQHKITDEDWRNRDKWHEYELAIEDVVRRTSTEIAPWTLVEGNSKHYARIKVLRTLCESLEVAFEK